MQKHIHGPVCVRLVLKRIIPRGITFSSIGDIGYCYAYPMERRSEKTQEQLLMFKVPKLQNAAVPSNLRQTLYKDINCHRGIYTITFGQRALQLYLLIR